MKMTVTIDGSFGVFICEKMIGTVAVYGDILEGEYVAKAISSHRGKELVKLSAKRASFLFGPGGAMEIRQLSRSKAEFFDLVKSEGLEMVVVNT